MVIQRRLTAICATAVIVSFFTGCSKKVSDEEFFKAGIQTAKQCAGDAHSARKNSDPKKASQSADVVRKLHADGTKRISKPDSTESWEDTLESIRKHLVETQRYEGLALNDQAREKACGKLSAKAYRGARKLAMAGLFVGMALAADQMVAAGTNSTPEELESTAESALSLVENLTGPQRTTDGDPDWKSVAKECRRLSDEKRVALSTHNLVLACGYLADAKPGLALVEVEMIEPSDENSETDLLAYHTVRGLIYYFNDMRFLALEEIEKASQLKGNLEESSEWKGLYPFVLAWLYLEQSDFDRCEAALDELAAVVPENTTDDYIRAEIRVGRNEIKEAAEDMRALAATKNDIPYYQEFLITRADELEAGRNTKPLALDKSLVRRLVLQHVREEAKESPFFKKIVSWMDSASEMIKELQSKLPDIPGIGASS